MKADEDLKKKTFILSSHRLSTIRNCEELILIEKDRGIIETGDVKKLLGTDSKTNEYFKKQLV